ncbi:MAG: hypothetical protein B9S32_04925 [Verrucomicrobia bacterium Tous-C9LFEB]|nr:MAG: hypothetical protein B9S32_04925 [Verrucomicrobia bacterium Tous-C9LFEB]
MKTIPSEIITYQDSTTGRTVRQLTAHKCHSHHFYFTNPGWWDQGHRLLMGSDRGGRTNLYSIHLESGEITQHTDADMPGPPRETSFLFAAVNPKRSECYFWRGPQLMAIDLLSNRERQLWTCPADYLPNMLNVTADGRFVCSVIYEDLSTRFKVDLMNGYVGFAEYFEAHPHSKIIRVPVDGGPCETLWEEDNWIGHINTSPTRSDLLTYCHEGPWDKVDNRMWILNLETGKTQAVRRRKMPTEFVGHEYWYADGETLGFHGSRPDLGGFFGSVRYDDSDQREYSAEGDTGHTHSRDCSLIVGDAGRHVRLWGRQGDRYGKSRLLCEHNGTSKTQQLHIHPRFSPDGKKVVFTSDRGGYGQVYEVEVGDWTDLPVSE